MSYHFSGSLQTKKKGELQVIAQQLEEPDGGTRDDLVKLITRHLEANPQLESDSRFSGLFTSRIRQRSLQPADVNEQDIKPIRRSRIQSDRDFSPLVEEVEREVTPPPGIRDAPLMVRHALQSPGSLPTPSPPRVGQSPRPVALPPTPAKSIASDTEAIEQPESQVTEARSSTVAGLQQYVQATRLLLSSSANIFIVSALLEFIAILYNIHINKFYPVPPLTVSAEPALRATALATAYWALPTIILPSLAGYLINFSPVSGSFDPLSASIIRVAANFIASFPSMVFLEHEMNVQTLDVLGSKWRTLSAAVNLAFAFAEALGRQDTQKL